MEGHALFPNRSEREKERERERARGSRPTKMKVTEKVGALLRSVSPACDDVCTPENPISIRVGTRSRSSAHAHARVHVYIHTYISITCAMRIENLCSLTIFFPFLLDYF